MEFTVNGKNIKLYLDATTGLKGIYKDNKPISSDCIGEDIFRKINFCWQALNDTNNLDEAIKRLHDYEYYPTITFKDNIVEISILVSDYYLYVSTYRYEINLDLILKYV